MKSYITSGDILSCRFVKFSDLGGIEQSSSSSDNIIGIGDSVDKEIGSTSDVSMPGEYTVIESGGAFSAGDALTSDSQGRAVLAKEGDNIGAIAYQTATEEGALVFAVVNIQRAVQTNTSNDSTENKD